MSERIVETVEDYLALPDGSIVAAPGEAPYVRDGRGYMRHLEYCAPERMTIRPRVVLREGWGDE